MLGEPESIVTASGVDAGLVLPLTSVCLVVKLCTPSVNGALGVMLQLPPPSATAVPRTVVPSVSYKVTVAPGSTAAPVMVGVVSLV